MIDDLTGFIEYMGLTPFQAILVATMLLTGLYVKWTFQHDNHDHDH